MSMRTGGVDCDVKNTQRARPFPAVLYYPVVKTCVEEHGEFVPLECVQTCGRRALGVSRFLPSKLMGTSVELNYVKKFYYKLTTPSLSLLTHALRKCAYRPMDWKMVLWEGSAMWATQFSAGPVPVTKDWAAKPTMATIARRPFLISLCFMMVICSNRRPQISKRILGEGNLSPLAYLLGGGSHVEGVEPLATGVAHLGAGAGELLTEDGVLQRAGVLRARRAALAVTYRVDGARVLEVHPAADLNPVHEDHLHPEQGQAVGDLAVHNLASLSPQGQVASAGHGGNVGQEDARNAEHSPTAVHQLSL
eukprot:2898782-Pyramimonas_sp.AAC.2